MDVCDMDRVLVWVHAKLEPWVEGGNTWCMVLCIVGAEGSGDARKIEVLVGGQ